LFGADAEEFEEEAPPSKTENGAPKKFTGHDVGATRPSQGEEFTTEAQRKQKHFPGG
jgi:hypothetical protein